MTVKMAGFTIIEVTLFLAISGLLLLMMFIGTGSIASRQRFTDTTDSLQSFFQGQYDEVVNGVNPRDFSNECDPSTNSYAGASQSCLMLGKLLTFSSDGKTITSRYVISTKRANDEHASPSGQLHSATVKAVDTVAMNYELKWGANITGATLSSVGPGARNQADSIAFLRLPASGQLVSMYFDNTSPGNLTKGLQDAIDAADVDGSIDPPTNSKTDPSFAVCIKNTQDFPVGSPTSAIIFGQGAIVTNYEPGALCP